ncbi:MAG: hypothetical protein C7B46_01395 [Sulfobacillus benefaciens]|uniref:Alkyl hydroperoxide reductase subunit C/ Thiol specific antioxidant domain-containing protein n=1 Tax=Sulfobacillus benefaciens TaxID=453960 RepID=A0A2T2XLN7_9FIRM|nr:MAG: hypothetical protein C7B46_01395 [Sulfobacillus benefaciens]
MASSAMVFRKAKWIGCKGGTSMTLAVGMTAPWLDVKLSNENRAALDSVSRPWSVLMFWKPHCQASHAALQALELLYQGYGPDLPVIGIAQDTQKGEGATFAQSLGVTFPILDDAPNYEISWLYDPLITPTLFVVDRKTLLVVDRLEAFDKIAFKTLSGTLAERFNRRDSVLLPVGSPDLVPG